jgi:predicted PurR-regulated permease PerM
VLGGGLNLFAFSGQLLTLVFLTYFLLASGDLFKRKLVRLAGPTLSKRRITVEIIDDINGAIENFLIVMAITNVMLGVATWLVFRWLGMVNAELWGVGAAVMNTIPYVGSLLVLIAATAIALIQFDSVSTALTVGGAFLVLTSLEGMLLKPWLMSRRAKLNTPAVFVALLFWGWLWGMWGLLLAFPILMVIKTIADHVEGLSSVAELIGE